MFASEVTCTATPSAVQTSIDPGIHAHGGVIDIPCRWDHRRAGIQRQVEVADFRIGQVEGAPIRRSAQRNRSESGRRQVDPASAALGEISSW